jgi:ferric-dicitrate binding protein FerR (iron transport regulator)
MPSLDPDDVASARDPNKPEPPRPKPESALKTYAKGFRERYQASIENQREYAEFQRKAAAAPASAMQVQQAIEQALEKQRRSRRGNTQGCGCLLILAGLLLCFLIPPLGGLSLLIGIIVLIVGLIL